MIISVEAFDWNCPQHITPRYTAAEIEAAGIVVTAPCLTGTLGTCATKVLGGKPDHRDSALTLEERVQAGFMCICGSRALTPRLVLDL